MNITRLLHWRQHHKPKHTATTPLIHDAIKKSAKRLQSVDPETNVQWQRLMRTLESKQSENTDHLADIRRIFYRPAFSLAVAATVLMIVGLGIWLRHAPDRIYQTMKGQHSTITLQDSTVVTLNSLSELIVIRSPLEKVRRVTLKGEAFFHVQRNGTPFIVSTDIGTAQVLGTEFNIRVRDNRMEVAVVTGCVKMSAMRHGADSSVILSKGQRAGCSQNDFPEMPTSFPFPQYPGWIHGKFIFYRTSVLSACKEMESQFDITIRLENPRLYDTTITGTVDGQSIDAALSTFAALTGNKVRHEKNGYIIY